ncbi:MAG: hypothetical protein V9G18_22430 [Albidovulum sp.]
MIGRAPAAWRQAAHAFLDARGFAPGSPFRAIAEALADEFAASPAPFRLPLALALELFGEEVVAAFAERAGPSGFAELRRAVAAVAVEFPRVTAEHVRVALNVLGQGGLVESAYREIDPATGAAADVSAEDVATLLRRAREPGPDAATAGERLVRISLDRWPVAPE